ncbi:ArsB/NhaD family transporter [Eubacterium sp. AB3007]|uniref:ArsB/NhaD family transporter n=1 Tax=Eubacterium sp. AB3007 TaxID=1392487 RepID=UPI000480D1FF|nr:ArsB/NhaD family transporter [Eubacterium sp. AB3007]
MSPQAISIIIFAITIVAIVTEKVHRTSAALAGVVLLLLTGVLSMETAVKHVDFNTLGVLLGMMLFVAVVRHSGLFEYISIKAAKLSHGDPWKITVAFMVITAICSAFLDNVTTVLLMGPMTITMAKMLKINPTPILLAQIVSSNIGGTMTMIGDPPNIMIGSAAHFTFLQFIENTGITCLIGLVVVIFGFKTVFKKRLGASDEAIDQVMSLDENKAIADKNLMLTSVFMIGVVVVAFMVHGKLGIDSATVALTAGVIMMIIGRQDIEEVVRDVEWTTILFFIGLFIVVGGMVETGVIKSCADVIMNISGGRVLLTMVILLWASAFFSSILDNIPFVATLIPLIQAMAAEGMDVTPLWWAISLGACLGGNGTMLGASANVVLCSIAGKNGYPITFNQYAKVGMPVMIVTVAIANVFLLVKFGLFA